MAEDEPYRWECNFGEVRIIPRCMGKISYDDGRTWWPRGPYEIHIAGDTYVLLTNGRYERLSQHPHKPERKQ